MKAKDPRITIKFSQEDFLKIREQSAKHNISMADYCRELIKTGKVKEALSQEEVILLNEVRQVKDVLKKLQSEIRNKHYIGRCPKCRSGSVVIYEDKEAICTNLKNGQCDFKIYLESSWHKKINKYDLIDFINGNIVFIELPSGSEIVDGKIVATSTKEKVQIGMKYSPTLKNFKLLITDNEKVKDYRNKKDWIKDFNTIQNEYNKIALLSDELLNLINKLKLLEK